MMAPNDLWQEFFTNPSAQEYEWLLGRVYLTEAKPALASLPLDGLDVAMWQVADGQGRRGWLVMVKHPRGSFLPTDDLTAFRAAGFAIWHP